MTEPFLSVGCPMWANRDWVGLHYPSATKAGTELTPYVTWCNAVEGNATFYACPSPSTTAAWARRTPIGFRFVCKLPRSITHDRRLRMVDREVREFLVSMSELEGRLGPLAVQLPASFEPGDLGVLEQFLDSLSTEFAWAVEVRNKGFFGGSDAERMLNEALHARGVDRIILDSRAVFAGPRETAEEIEAFAKKPNLEVKPVATGSQPIIRFIGQRSLPANEPYWRMWLPAVTRWIDDGRSPIVFLHTPDNLDAPVLARQFFAAVRQQRPLLAPLSTPARPGTQPGLFEML